VSFDSDTQKVDNYCVHKVSERHILYIQKLANELHFVYMHYFPQQHQGDCERKNIKTKFQRNIKVYRQFP
jgi:hypothetical protein